MIGQLLGHYRIESKLGYGGMGVVYKATDTHLDRPVAVKVLRPEAVTSPERKRRFVQEAKAASALNHPNILHIYDIDESGGVAFITMEYVQGQTLDQRIPRKGLRINDALKYAVQMADALAAAHAAGIVHRDLKPGNLMVTESGLVKVLDFGLAKLVEPAEAGDSAPTQTIKDTPETEEGAILGTVAYMSPEQAEGKKVDSRSDIFTFGTVLYEMLTGRRPFQGETRLSTLSAILGKDPKSAREAVPELPLEMDRILTRCLRKDPSRRFQHMADLRIALNELREESASGVVTGVSPPVKQRFPKWALAASAILIVAAASFLWWRNAPAEQAQSPVLTRLTADSGLTTDPAISPDGKLVAYASDRGAERNLDIWVQQVSGGPPLRLTHHEADDSQPAFSPDSSRIAFRSERDGGGIYLIPTLGGEEQLFARRGVRPRFSPDGKWIVYAVGLQTGDITAPHTRRIYVASTAGGPHKELAQDFQFALTPIWAPDSSHVLFLGSKDRMNEVDWWVVPVDGTGAIRTGARASLGSELFDYPETWSADGKSVVFSTSRGDSTNLWQVPVSVKTWHAAGPAQRLTTGSGIETQPSVSQSGLLVFSNITESTNIWSLPLAANLAKVTGEARQLTSGAMLNTAPHLSADGRKLAFNSNRSGNYGIWLKDLVSGRETPVSPGSTPSQRPAISADGTRVAYSSPEDRKVSLYVAPIGRTGEGPQETIGAAEKMCENCGQPLNWSYAGDKILCLGLKSPRTIVLLRPASKETVDLLKHPEFNLYGARFSPDDRWVVFQARVTPERLQLFIAPFRDSGTAAKEWIPISDPSYSSREASWSPDGNTLYFASDRDGFLCLWSQRLDATKRPAGPPLPIYHLHQSRQSLASVLAGTHDTSVARDKLVFPLCERTGNIWMMQLNPRRAVLPF